MIASSALTVPTFVIAIVGLALSVAALTWQVATFLLSGSRVQANLRIGAFGNGAIATALVGPGWDQKMQGLAQQGFSRPVLGVEVRSVGRLAIDVVRCQAVFENGVAIYASDGGVNPPAGTRLDHGQTRSWYVEIPAIQAAARANVATGLVPADRPQLVRMRVELGTGKSVTTKEALPFGP